MIRFFWGGVVSISPNPQDGGPPRVGCLRLLIQYIRSYLPHRKLFLHLPPEDAPCRGDRDRQITVILSLMYFEPQCQVWCVRTVPSPMTCGQQLDVWTAEPFRALVLEFYCLFPNILWCWCPKQLGMYFPRNWEFGSALSKLPNFGGGGVWTPQTPSVRHCIEQQTNNKKTRITKNNTIH
jgi:hypothetical protein